MVLKYGIGDVLFEWPQRHEQLKGEDKNELEEHKT